LKYKEQNKSVHGSWTGASCTHIKGAG